MKRKSFVGEPIRSSSGSIFINPGTGPVENASTGHARQNISQLIIDAGFDLDDVAVDRVPEQDRAGRFCFSLEHQNRTCEIMMPGLDISEVRYLGNDDQNPWHFPRLYVDGSSWLWSFATGIAGDVLRGEVDEDY